MIELINKCLRFSFPEIHQKATLNINFQRTLRIPDDGRKYSLPPGLGSFPLRHVDDFAKNVSQLWLEHGGVMLPMYQSEALWLNFDSDYPFAIKVAAGKINAVTGDPWKGDRLRIRPQDYLVAPDQPWLDGYCIEKGMVRQFVAMPLGAGYSAEEQLTGEAVHGGLQIVAYPMKTKIYNELKKSQLDHRDYAPPLYEDVPFGYPSMGLAPGGKMDQEIYEDDHGVDAWDQKHKSRCFIHLANSMMWHSITGENPPTVPLTAKEYTEANLPWFDYYSESSSPLEGSVKLKGMKSIVELGKKKGELPLPENESVSPENIIKLRAKLSKNQVREGEF